jgi:NADH:ubiquinone oxidoreductase subunit 6 (subunit J)
MVTLLPSRAIASVWGPRVAEQRAGRRWSHTPVEHLDLPVLAVMMTVFVVGRNQLPTPVGVAAWFAGLFALTAVLPRITHRWPSGAWIRLIVPGVVLLSVYESLGPVIAALGPPPRDAWLITIEQWVMGGRLLPLTLLPLPAFAFDALSVAYVAYFGLPVVLIWSLIRRRQLREAQAAMLTLLIAFYVHYLIYFVMPAVGPVRTTELPACLRLQMIAAGGPLTDVLRHLVGTLERTPQDAFPSAHTSIAVLGSALARKYHLPFRRCFYVTTAAIVASTVLLAYHYLVDVLAAFPVAWLARQAARRIEM